MTSQWSQFVQLFAEKNPQLTREEVLKYAKKPFQQLKQYYNQRGGDLLTEYLQKYGFSKSDICDPSAYIKIKIAGKTYQTLKEIPDHIFKDYQKVEDYHVYIQACLGNEIIPLIIERLVEKLGTTDPMNLHITQKDHIDILLGNRSFLTLFQQYLTIWPTADKFEQINNEITDFSIPTDRNGKRIGRHTLSREIIQQNGNYIHEINRQADRLWDLLDDSASKLIHAGLINAGKPFIPRYSDQYSKSDKPCIYCDPEKYTRIKGYAEEFLEKKMFESKTLQEQQEILEQKRLILERKKLQEQEEMLERRRLREEAEMLEMLESKRLREEAEMLQRKKLQERKSELAAMSMWTCDACRWENPDALSACEICDTPKPK